jgi:beta-N-acetylhexosaminidase
VGLAVAVGVAGIVYTLSRSQAHLVVIQHGAPASSPKVVTVTVSRGNTSPRGSQSVPQAFSPEAEAPSELVPRPAIVWRPIPFTAKRRAETAAYERRHYGISSWRLVHPHVIVDHYTVSTSFSSAYNTFAADVPDSELHELPGLCAHFIVDSDGAVYQLVPLSTICRHTVGLNWTAIGIEHVGTSDAEILENARQLHSSLRLTLWLMRRFGIRLANVIGHNESLTSPYHRELIAALRCQTHGDWTRSDMQIYRRRLLALGRSYRLALGPLPPFRATSC